MKFKIGDFVECWHPNLPHEKFIIKKITQCNAIKGTGNYKCNYYDNNICPGYINNDCFGYSENYYLRKIGTSNPNSDIILKEE